MDDYYSFIRWKKSPSLQLLLFLSRPTSLSLSYRGACNCIISIFLSDRISRYLGWYCSSNIILQRFEEAWKSAILSKCAWNRKNAREKARWRYYSYLTSFARKRIKLLEREREREFSTRRERGKRERDAVYWFNCTAISLPFVVKFHPERSSDSLV